MRYRKIGHILLSISILLVVFFGVVGIVSHLDTGTKVWFTDNLCWDNHSQQMQGGVWLINLAPWNEVLAESMVIFDDGDSDVNSPPNIRFARRIDTNLTINKPPTEIRVFFGTLHWGEKILIIGESDIRHKVIKINDCH